LGGSSFMTEKYSSLVNVHVGLAYAWSKSMQEEALDCSAPDLSSKGEVSSGASSKSRTHQPQKKKLGSLSPELSSSRLRSVRGGVV